MGVLCSSQELDYLPQKGVFLKDPISPGKIVMSILRSIIFFVEFRSKVLLCVYGENFITDTVPHTVRSSFRVSLCVFIVWVCAQVLLLLCLFFFRFFLNVFVPPVPHGYVVLYMCSFCSGVAKCFVVMRHNVA